MDPDPVYGSEEHYRACARRARAVRRRLGRQWQVIANNATPTLTKAKIQQDLKRRPGDWSFFLDRLAGGFAKADLGPASYNEKRAAYLSEIIGETRYTISNPISGP